MLLGIDYLAALPNREAINHYHPEGFAAGFFVDESLWGDAKPVIIDLITSTKKKVPAIRLHFNWNDNHHYSFSTEQELDTLKKQASQYKRLIEKNPHVKWYVTAATEHLLTPDQAQAAANVLKIEFPTALVLDNPQHAFKGSNTFSESHTAKKGIDVFSYDGMSCFDADVLNDYDLLKTTCCLFFLWCPSCNGHPAMPNAEHPALERSKRAAYLTKELIESMGYMGRQLQKGRDIIRVSFPGNWLFKSHADCRTRPQEKRAYKPVVIADVLVDHLVLTSKNEVRAEINTYKSSPAFTFGNEKKLWRYYFDEYGYKMAKKSDHGLLTFLSIKDGEATARGMLNPAFRHGFFRKKE
jgi:hypothetical protein